MSCQLLYRTGEWSEAEECYWVLCEYDEYHNIMKNQMQNDVCNEHKSYAIICMGRMMKVQRNIFWTILKIVKYKLAKQVANHDLKSRR